ncbi:MULTISPECIES: HlyD family type I secretion periplasmic adaptor subunit [unclassified Nitrobacter]|uniref:HlyD family type I secretion periplasmic adaptor subunit n=1 Tax=unclassified Nitrobacter TaxID=2620411 RepID=UPI000AF89DC6|nr:MULTISPECIES: HlyD family type I secretion periplasmic adaptor subunit [unclassified Nitrobacter]MBN9149229.1 HlyD family type I secretion periplasmic adaptor subunit [Nitrobacter sp.]
MTGDTEKPSKPRQSSFARLRDNQRRKREISRATPARLPVVSEFQSDAMEIEQRKPPRLARITLYCVVVLIFAATVWATVSHVDMIVTAQGRLITTRPNMVVQPLETSVIREIHVRAGDVVNRGDVLATLDPTFSQADLDQLRDRVSALDAAINRLNAELAGKDYTVTNPSDPDQILQDKLFQQRKSFNVAQLSNFDAQIASARANLETSHNEENVLVQRLETMNSIESMRSTLMEKKVGSRLNFLLSRDARLEVESNLSRARGSQVDYAHRVEKVSADRQVFIEDFRKQASQDLVETVAKRNGAAEDLKKAELRRKLIVLTAPADAIVLEVANRTVGSVAREAETLFVLVPRNVPLQAEVDVEGRDIGQVEVGQPVRIKYEAYPFQKFGTGSGTVRVVSHDAFAPDAKNEPAHRIQAPYYRVLVDVADTKLRRQPEHMQLLPGMAVTAELKVGSRRVISYFLYPLLRGLDESIREY